MCFEHQGVSAFSYFMNMEQTLFYVMWDLLVVSSFRSSLNYNTAKHLIQDSTIGNKTVVLSDVVGASPAGTAPITS